MTKAIYYKTPTGFAPRDEDGQKYWSRFAVGDEVMLTFTRPRSLPQLKLYWTVVRIAYNNNDGHFQNEEECSDSIKLACGLSQTTHIKYNGEWFERRTPTSIAFENMGQDDFNAFFEKVLAYVCTELVPGLDPNTLQQEAMAA